MEIPIAERLSLLGHAQRLDIFRLLVRRFPDRLPAGEIAGALGLRPSTLSSHLAALRRTGLITQHRAGTFLLYAADLPEMRRTFDYLLLDCGRGRPDLVPTLIVPDPEGGPPMPERKFKTLFICTGNSARSIFAEAILRREAGDRFEAYSAGTRPHSELNPFAIDLLRDKGYDVAPLRAKNVDAFRGPDAPAFDFVFTVCNRAANEDCPAWAGQPVSGHWGMPDPVKAEGNDAQKALAFQQAYGALRNRILAFTALPLASLDRISLQHAVDEIGRAEAGATA